ncbi:oxysterol-binding protein 1-like [Cimex lectularius]|uniref:Uncharacterized protein n=1 Tax=Cimex lectularius TaxID=79782 RepID=A0A8I6S8M2_CIMLE|nr:oxysterol-binding protein 1-like [Cimex lectularius]
MEAKTVADFFYRRWRRQGAVEVHWRTLDDACTLHGEVDQLKVEDIGFHRDSDESVDEEECPDEKKNFTLDSSESEMSEPIPFIQSKKHTLKYLPQLENTDNIWYTEKDELVKKPDIEIQHESEEKKKIKAPPAGASITSAEEERKSEVEKVIEKKERSMWDEFLQDEWKELEPSSDQLIREVKQRRTSLPFKPTVHPRTYKNFTSRYVDWIQAPLEYYEPLSVLQKIAEDFEYTKLLDAASRVQDELKQICYIGAFSVTSLAMSPFRTAWQFIPLLGETYELDRTDDLGWYLLSECVSIKPPIIAQFCVSKEWICFQQFYYKVVYLRDEYVVAKQLSVYNLHFKSTGRHYTWKKRISFVCDAIEGHYCVHNIQNIDIVNNDINHVCHVLLTPYENWLEKQETVKGAVVDDENTVRWVFDGLWNMKIEMAQVKIQPGCSFDVILSRPLLYQGPRKVIWQLNLLPPECENFYNFSYFACNLNEFDATVPPTDSRRRSDIRTFEDGNWSLCEKLTKHVRQTDPCRCVDRRPVKELLFEKTLFLDHDRFQEDYQHSIWFTKTMVPVENTYEVDDCSEVDDYVSPKWHKRKYIKRKKEDMKCTYTGNYYYLKWLQEWEYSPIF